MHRQLRAVSAAWKTPHVAILAVCGAALAIAGLSAPLGDAVFLAIASLATTGLYVSYAIPILLGAIARTRGRWTRLGPWHLGRFGIVIAWGAVAWTVAVLVVCSLPPNATAGMTIAGVGIALVVFYFGVVRRRFRGPKLDLATLERQ
jgi:amino acid transporter